MKGKVVLITGAGSLGTALTEKLLKTDVETIRVLDNNENTLQEFRTRFKRQNGTRVRKLLGDIIDYQRVLFACRNANLVIHTSAVKHVDLIEYNPIHAIGTNISGLINVIHACGERGVKKMLFISSDKAVLPTSFYGLTKAVGEKLVLWAHQTSPGTIFSTIRFPNFLPSRGSVFEVWEEQVRRGEPITITDENMERFFLPIERCAELCLEALKMMKGGEIFVPFHVEKYKIIDLAKQYSMNYEIIGRRPGERLREIMMTDEELSRAKREGSFWVIR